MAYFLWRSGVLAGEARALETASAWIARAERDLSDPGAFVVESSRVFPDLRGPSLDCSVHFGEPGVWFAAALVADAIGAPDATDRAVERFRAIAEACPEEAFDATHGTAGLLLATAILVEELADPHRWELHLLGERLAARLTAAVGTPEQSGPVPVELLGAAHGWSGIAHAQLRWCQTTGTAPGATLRALIAWLEEQRLPTGLWPRQAGSTEVWPGWCHGSAGWAQLWTLASEVLGEDRLIELAERAAIHALGPDRGEGAGLCCGQAGEAYAALALHRATGEQRWLEEARRRAESARLVPTGPDFPEHSLWRGDLGVALLLMELGEPEHAAMPVYNSITGPVTVRPG